MPHLTRRGFSLVELLIAMVLLAIVVAGLYRALMTNQRVYQQQTQVIGLQQNMRAAAAILPQELRELDATGGDIYAMTATSLTIRANRWTALMCLPPATGLLGLIGPQQINGATMIIRGQLFFGRGINLATDSMFIRYEGDDGTRKDDGYVLAKPTLTAAAVCPLTSGGGAGTLVTMNLDFRGNINFPTSIVSGDPVHGFEPVTYSLYQPTTGGDWYVGLTTSSGQQPLIGPVLANGLSFAYYDSTGVVTALPTRVARVDITLRAQTAQLIRAQSGSNSLVRMVDSVLTSVALRNNRRY
ncbi:MAG TPA: prepilin-type N-terminal cleavage/methylation domain-containing protein [Gemmatimonadales bacterium]|jgi:prepilin-type N-terminal cleavage/methylation domain-containing protein